MGDAIYPAHLPAGLDAYAGYDMGSWPDFAAIASAHASAHLIEICPFLANRGTFIDVERFDATAAQAPTYIALRMQAGVVRPGVYSSIVNMGDIVGRLGRAGFERHTYRLLSAHYGAGKHICGPSTCRMGPQCDGTQWIDHGGWDESLLDDHFFATLAPGGLVSNLAAPICAIVPRPQNDGYWLVGRDGGIFSFGAAGTFKPNPVVPGSAREIIDAKTTATGGGLYLAGADGGVFTYGDAGFFGSVPTLNVGPSSLPPEG